MTKVKSIRISLVNVIKHGINTYLYKENKE